MPYRVTPFETGSYYHVYNRGIDGQNTFLINRDYSRFLKTVGYYQIQNPKPKYSTYSITKTFPINKDKRIIDIVCYSLMPNHFHLLVQQTKDSGVSEFVRKFIHSYTKYFNVKHSHKGPIYNPVFKAVPVENDEQLLHLSRYIHLNSLVSGLVTDLDLYPWSSYQAYLGETPTVFPLAKEKILEFFDSPLKYKEFVLSRAEYGETLELIKHSTIDLEL